MIKQAVKVEVSREGRYICSKNVNKLNDKLDVNTKKKMHADSSTIHSSQSNTYSSHAHLFQIHGTA